MPKAYYGVLARKDGEVNDDTTESPAYVESIVCGRLVRKAWLTGKTQ